MKAIIKPAIFLLINLVLNFLIFVQYLKSTNYSGGEVGMVPMIILLISIISFLFSLIIISIINYYKSISILKSVLIYNSTYFLTMIFFGLNPAEGKGVYENIDLFTILIAIVSMILTWILLAVHKKYYKNT